MADVVPTDPHAESERGRVALWLDPSDIRWLAQHCCCDDDASEEDRDRCSRIRFRSSAALRKSRNSA